MRFLGFFFSRIFYALHTSVVAVSECRSYFKTGKTSTSFPDIVTSNLNWHDCTGQTVVLIAMSTEGEAQNWVVCEE